MVRVAVVVDGEQDFAVNAVAVIPDEFPRRFRQPRELLGRITAVEALHEAPDLGPLANELIGEDAESVNFTFAEISPDQQHRPTIRNQRARIAIRARYGS